jgi:hypothetical protein
VPYTHPVRPGGTEQAAPCHQRRAPEEDVACSQKQSFRQPPWKLEDAEGRPATSGTTLAPQSKKRASQSRNPPASTAGQDWKPPRSQLGAHLPRLHGRPRGAPGLQVLPLNSSSRLLGTLSKGLAASDLPAEIHHGSGTRPPSADHLALCRSTRIVLSPCNLSSRPRLRAQPNPPPPPHQAGQEQKEKRRRELSSRDADLI